MEENKEQKIKVTKDGPYLVSGNIPLDKQMIVCDKEGVPEKWKTSSQKYPLQKTYALCRCGHSDNLPFCDGSHSTVNFDGTETANNKKYIDQAKKIDGPELLLTDAIDFCSSAKFCERMGGIWDLTRNSGNPKARELAIRQACDCPSGRLVMWEKLKNNKLKEIEPNFKPSISLIEDPLEKVSGPLWVKGKIQIESSDGKKYEKRNRVTLCRCGRSENKPFCDTSHIAAGFTDHDESLKKGC